MITIGVVVIGLLVLAAWGVFKKKASGYSPDGYKCGRRSHVYDTEFDPFFHDYGRKYSVDWRMIKAIGWNESMYDPCAVGAFSDVGIMQVTRPWENQLDIDIDTVEGNIDAAAAILRYELDRWKDELKAVAAYNGGDHRVSEAVGSDLENWRAYLLPSIQRYVKNYIETVTAIRAFYSL